MASSIVITNNLVILLVLVLVTVSCSASEINASSSSSKITNFTIGAVLSDERHDTLFREAITVSAGLFLSSYLYS